MDYHKTNNLIMFFAFLLILANLLSKAHGNRLESSSLLYANLLSTKITSEHLKEKHKTISFPA